MLANPAQLEKIRQSFRRYLNPFMITLWRLGLGEMLNWSPSVGGRIMVLTHTGRKSGLSRRTPVNYEFIDGNIYCVAGFGRVSDWFRNIRKHPEVDIWLPGAWYTGRALEITDDPRRLEYLRKVLIASGFAAFAAGIDPYRMSDSDLLAATKDYAVVKIERIAARTGAGGPGEFAWIWPLATFILLGWVFRRGCRK